MANARPQTAVHIRFATVAIQKFRQGEPIQPRTCTREYFGDYLPLITDMSAALHTAMHGTEDEASVLATMDAYWTAVREEQRYPDLIEAVETCDLEEAARPPISTNGQGATVVDPPALECPPLPLDEVDDAAYITRFAAEASAWLDDYIAFSRTWAPRAYNDFHEACGLFVLSTVAARRVRIEFGHGVYTSLYQALVSRTTLFAKTTAAAIAQGFLRQAGLTHLLSPDDATPQAFLRGLVARIPDDYGELPRDTRERLMHQLAFPAQRGWFYEEFGQHLSAMMQRDGIMAAFRGILRRFDDHKESFSHETIGRGLEEITKPYLSLLGTLTPADLKPFAHVHSSLWGDGYFARFAFITAPLTGYTDAPYPKERLIYPAALVERVRSWHDRLGTSPAAVLPILDHKEQPTGRYRVVPGQLPEVTYRVSDGVYDAFYAYDTALRQLISEAAQQDLDGSYGRFAMKALRIAGLLASLDDDPVMPTRMIQLRHWYRGRQIAERWRASLHRLVAQLEADLPADTREQRVEQRVERALRRFGTLPIRDLHLKTNLSYGDLNKAMQALLAAGVVEIDGEHSHRTTRYRVVYQSPNGNGAP